MAWREVMVRISDGLSLPAEMRVEGICVVVRPASHTPAPETGTRSLPAYPILSFMVDMTPESAAALEQLAKALGDDHDGGSER